MSFSTRIEDIIAGYVHPDLQGTLYHGTPLVRPVLNAFFFNVIERAPAVNLSPQFKAIDDLARHNIKTLDSAAKTSTLSVTLAGANKLGVHFHPFDLLIAGNEEMAEDLEPPSHDLVMADINLKSKKSADKKTLRSAEKMRDTVMGFYVAITLDNAQGFSFNRKFALYSEARETLDTTAFTEGLPQKQTKDLINNFLEEVYQDLTEQAATELSKVPPSHRKVGKYKTALMHFVKTKTINTIHQDIITALTRIEAASVESNISSITRPSEDDISDFEISPLLMARTPTPFEGSASQAVARRPTISIQVPTPI